MTENKFKNFRFEELEVWKLGMKIVEEVYQLTKKFPKSELYSLTDQLKRASTSIVLNIAEGSGQMTSKSFALYIQRSKSSLLECSACIKIAIQEGFISEKEIESINAIMREEYFKLVALYKAILKR